jgi:hypothetical protein
MITLKNSGKERPLNEHNFGQYIWLTTFYENMDSQATWIMVLEKEKLEYRGYRI